MWLPRQPRTIEQTLKYQNIQTAMPEEPILSPSPSWHCLHTDLIFVDNFFKFSAQDLFNDYLYVCFPANAIQVMKVNIERSYFARRLSFTLSFLLGCQDFFMVAIFSRLCQAGFQRISKSLRTLHLHQLCFLKVFFFVFAVVIFFLCWNKNLFFKRCFVCITVWIRGAPNVNFTLISYWIHFPPKSNIQLANPLKILFKCWLNI